MTADGRARDAFEVVTDADDVWRRALGHERLDVRLLAVARDEVVNQYGAIEGGKQHPAKLEAYIRARLS